MWFKNRRAKCRQQATHQQSTNINSSSKSSGNSTSSSSRHGLSSNSTNTTSSSGSTNASHNNNNNNNNSKSTTAGGNNISGSSSTSKSSVSASAMNKHNSLHGISASSFSNNSGSTGVGVGGGSSSSGGPGGVSGSGASGISHHNSSPILPMTPSTSVSPPINVICKKEMAAYHAGASLTTENMNKISSPYDVIKDEMAGMAIHGPYSNISRLGHTGNLTPLGSNSTVMSTPSPPNTPQTNLSYHPNSDYFYYQHYQNNYNSSYYPSVEYQSQANYNPSGYGTTNFGIPSGSSLGGSMVSQSFSPNGMDYMSPQDKYMNMHVA